MINIPLCCLVYIYCLSVAATLQCLDSTFHRRYEFDNHMFSDATLLSEDVVDNRADCVTKCQMTPLCNQAMYNDITRRCRLHSDSVRSETEGTFDYGWQYYGPSCDVYRLNNSDTPANVLSENADDVCNVGYHALTTCTATSCYFDGTWRTFAVKCTLTLFAYPNTPKIVAKEMSCTTDFDLHHGHVISLQVTGSGSTSTYDEVEFTDDNNNIPYHLSLRWLTSHTECLVATRTTHSAWVQGEKKFYILDQYIEDRSNYTIDIHILDTVFKAYGNGHLLIANNMTLPFTGVRKITIKGISTVYKLKVGPDICP